MVTLPRFNMSVNYFLFLHQKIKKAPPAAALFQKVEKNVNIWLPFFIPLIFWKIQPTQL